MQLEMQHECLIAVKYVGAELPKDEHLMEAESRNKDGIGVAYWKSGGSEVNIKKDFKNAIELIAWLKENIKKEDICIIHFRLATHGLKDEGNRHPFPITKNKELLRQTTLVCQMAVAHNGILNQYNEHKKYSDTQKFILDILAEDDIKNNLNNEKIRKLIGFYLGGDRLAILRNDGMVFLFGEYVKEEDILYSNSSYKVYITTYDYNKGTNNKGYKGECDCCGEDKYCNWMQDLTDKVQEWLLCKSCRKKYRKGKVKPEEFIVSIIDQDEGVEEEIIISGDKTKGNHSVYCLCNSCKERRQLGKIKIDTDRKCDNCDMWFSENELFPYYSYNLCRKCINELDYYNTEYAKKLKDKNEIQNR